MGSEPQTEKTVRGSKNRRKVERRYSVPPGTDLEPIAERVHYTGSGEHKRFPSFAGPPRARVRASLCPRDLDLATINGWLRSAVRSGAVGGEWEGMFPRYVWHREGDTVFEGRLVNRGNCSYKGYPLEKEEWPKRLRGTR